MEILEYAPNEKGKLPMHVCVENDATINPYG